MGEASARFDRHIGTHGDTSATRRVCACAASFLAVLLSAPGASAQEFTPAIHVLGIYQGSDLSNTAAGLANGGYELSDGTPVSLYEWYRTDWPDTYIDMMTQLSDDFGFLWGVSTGERGEKYTIDPSVTFGFVTQAHPGTDSVLSLTVTTTVWGNLTEHTCEGDYGEIGGGLQTVNCRLAAEPIPTEETLKYLADAEPNRLHVSLTYSVSF